MRKIWFLSLVFAVLFLGCAPQQPKNEEISKTTSSKNFINNSHIKVISPKINDWLKMEFLNYTKKDDGLLEFEANFINLANANRLVSYKIIWKDKNGFTQKSIMSKWVKTLVEAGRVLSIHAISPNDKSVDFEIILQEPTKDDKNRDDSSHKKYSN